MRRHQAALTDAEMLAAGFKPMPAIQRKRRSPLVAVAIGLAIVALAEAGVAGWKIWQARRPPTTHAAIAVLPFKTNAPDGAADWFAEVIGEDVTRELSRIPGAMMVARASTQPFAADKRDLREIARELGVRYLVTGSVSRTGESASLRLTLIDAKDGASRWSGRMDTPVVYLPTAERAMAQRIGYELNLRVVESEAPNLFTGVHPDAAHLALQAWSASNRDTAPEAVLAKSLALKALEVDEKSAMAWKTLASWHLRARTTNEIPAEEAVAGAAKAAERAREIGPNNPLVNMVYGASLVLRGKHDEGRTALEREIETNPSHPLAYHYLGLAHLMAGRAADAARAWERAIAVSPRDPRMARFRRHLAMAYLHAGKLPEARTQAQEALAARPGDMPALAMLTSVCVQLQEAQCSTESAAALRKAAPDFDVAKAESEWPPAQGPNFEAQHAPYLRGLETALRAP